MNHFNFDAEDKTINDILFTQNRFRIPPFQRPYSWTLDEISDFWEDLRLSRYSFFLGSFVFNFENAEKDKTIEVIDGQQRLLSITILMSVLRDVAKVLKDNDLSKRIQNSCIAFEDKRGNQTYRIECADSLKDFFAEYIQKDDHVSFPARLKSEHKLVVNNYNFLRSEIEDELNSITSLTEKIERIHEIWEKVANLKVIWIEIANEEAAYTIFETVNARGAELSVADLLKNLIFKNVKKTDSGLDKAKTKWTQIEENVAESGVELSKFIRHLWLSKNGLVGEKDLYREIKANISNFEKFLDEILEASEMYRMLLRGTKEEWLQYNEKGRSIYRSLLGIRAMRATQCHVLFLAVLRNMKKIGFDVSGYFEAVEKFTFLYSAVSKLQANKAEKLYSATAVALETAIKEKNAKTLDKKIHSVLDSFVRDLKSHRPEFPIFLERFKEIQYKKSESVRVLIKYILSKLNDIDSSGELGLDFDVVNIEHIVPQKPHEDWKLERDDIKGYVNSLGNLVLLSKVLNSEAQNDVLKKKIPILKLSEIISTKNLAKRIEDNKYVWGEKEIEKRVVDLAEVAFKEVWVL